MPKAVAKETRACAQCSKPITRLPSMFKADHACCSRLCKARWGADHGGRFPDGATRINNDGYVLVKKSDATRYAGTPGWVLEHRWKMEQRIGRELLPNEEVHHKNTIRHDNAGSNLELWTSRQPVGARVSDLLAWAHELIELYEDVPLGALA